MHSSRNGPEGLKEQYRTFVWNYGISIVNLPAAQIQTCRCSFVLGSAMTSSMNGNLDQHCTVEYKAVPYRTNTKCGCLHATPAGAAHMLLEAEVKAGGMV